MQLNLIFIETVYRVQVAVDTLMKRKINDSSLNILCSDFTIQG